MPFRIGRKHAQHFYPEAREATTVPAAKNYAFGPATNVDVAIGAGTQIPWGTVAVPSVDPEDIPITPQSSGIVRISGTIVVQNSGANPASAQIIVEINDIPQGVGFTAVTIDPTNLGEEILAFESIPILVDISGLPIGVTSRVQIRAVALTADVVDVVAGSSTLQVLEIPPSTG